MTTAIFGKPESAGVVFVDPLLLEHATLIYRAIHTLEILRDHNVIDDDDSIASLFVQQSWHDLRRLLDWYKAQGVRVRDIDIGG